MSSRPSTPAKGTPSAPTTPHTGSWKHPRFDEITRRQNATTFSDNNLRRILYNVGGLFAWWFSAHFMRANVPTLYAILISCEPFSTYVPWALRVMLLYNIVVALLPLARPKDDLSDIPLTPAQRKLLGLAPSSAPPTPGSQYATPPRYARTPTPLNDSPKGIFSGSPLSGKGSGAQASPRDSQFSPNASPLLHKTMGGISSIRRSSYGSPSPLGSAAQKSWTDGPSTPSPSIGNGGASVGLNNKWLYERGRSSPGNTTLFS